MSKPRYRWWGYVKNIIRAYPDLERRLQEIKEPSITANPSGGTSGGKGVSRTVEVAALRELPREEQKEYEAVHRAVLITQQMRTGRDRLKLVELCYWKKSHTLEGAADKIHVSYDTAIDYNGDFIMLTAYNLGLIAYDGLRQSQKFALKSQKHVVE